MILKNLCERNVKQYVDTLMSLTKTLLRTNLIIVLKKKNIFQLQLGYGILGIHYNITGFQDIEWLADQLPRRPTRKIESVRNFSHLDFSLNKDLENLLTRPLATLISELSKKQRVSPTCTTPWSLPRIRDLYALLVLITG